ncbi:MAG: hypothetical protein ACM3YM_11845 [Sphingomonadales bacterium]
MGKDRETGWFERGDDGTRDARDSAISSIEAALEAALGGGDGARPDLARQVLQGRAPDPHVERWLESIAVELQASGSALVPNDMADLVAKRIVSNRSKSLGAYARVRRSTVRTLMRRS